MLIILETQSKIMMHQNPLYLRMSKKRLILLTAYLFLVACTLMVATTPLHEIGHLVLSSCDPSLKVVAFHPLGSPHITQGDHTFSSILGYVVVKEAYPGAFQNRVFWADAAQECICILIQIGITFLITIKILGYLFTPASRKTCSMTGNGASVLNPVGVK